jgi:acyl carrier protein
MTDEELQRSFTSGDVAERERLLRETIRTYVAKLLTLDAIEDDSNFLELVLNSLSAIELTKRLMTITDMEIPLVTIVDHPTPARLASHLAGEYSGTGEGIPR